jgi:hypothetical protein
MSKVLVLSAPRGFISTVSESKMAKPTALRTEEDGGQRRI